ncbi:conserved hypothetical integral membrane protein [Listeria grayi]|uniref:DUF1146 domain-containing protein n=1 Tax=Listeria grayi FSL F6-1183 TaxID=1265827 RepID=A0A829R8B1_LISGR|nr:DUF1146 family protein [Listeria grayi]EUJ28266.1 hypothetical protein LMUR_06869 [Listeria grayi FSL F6-1183]VEI36374.1 conserved hypothetical integral membrane protein [Listeria grayi]
MYNIIMEQPITIIISHLLFTVIAFWALQAIQYEKWLKKNHVMQARLLFVMLSVAIGYTVSKFFLEYLAASKQLVNLFS